MEPHQCVYLCVCVSCSVVSDSDSTDHSPSGSSVHGISQARILERITTSFSRGYSWPRDQTRVSRVSCTDRQILCHCTTQSARTASDRAIIGASSVKHSSENSSGEGKYIYLYFVFLLFFLSSWCSKIPSLIISFVFREFPLPILVHLWQILFPFI